MNNSLFQNDDRRTNKRFPIKLKAILDKPGTIQMMTVDNVSHVGLFLNSHYTMPEGSPIRMWLFLPDQYEPNAVFVNGEVVYNLEPAVAETRGSEPGIGVRLNDVPKSDHDERFRSFLSTLEMN